MYASIDNKVHLTVSVSFLFLNKDNANYFCLVLQNKDLQNNWLYAILYVFYNKILPI